MKDNTNTNTNANATAANADNIAFSGYHAPAAISNALSAPKIETRTLASKGDINDGAAVVASGLTAFGKWAVAQEATPTANGGNLFIRFRDEIIADEMDGKAAPAHIEEIPTFGARYAAYTADKATVYTLARSYCVRLGNEYASAIFARRGIIIPTLTDYETAEKIAKILNRLFIRKEKAGEVFGKSASDVAQARIRTLEETQKRLLAEIAALKELTGGKA